MRNNIEDLEMDGKWRGGGCLRWPNARGAVGSAVTSSQAVRFETCGNCFMARSTLLPPPRRCQELRRCRMVWFSSATVV